MCVWVGVGGGFSFLCVHWRGYLMRFFQDALTKIANLNIGLEDTLSSAGYKSNPGIFRFVFSRFVLTNFANYPPVCIRISLGVAGKR